MAINYGSHELITTGSYRVSSSDLIGEEIFVAAITWPTTQNVAAGQFPDITKCTASKDTKSGYNGTTGYYTFQQTGLYLIEAQGQFVSMCVNDRTISALYINSSWFDFGETVIPYYKSDWGSVHSGAFIRSMSVNQTIALASFVDATQATCENPPQTRKKLGKWRIFRINNAS